MELRHLRYFCAVAERQSFTLAARDLHVSQSGISGQVRDLESELGTALLFRTQREVSLTPEGALFLHEAQQILAHAERAVQIVQRSSRGEYGNLAVGLCGPATAPFLPGLIRQFRKRQPGVVLNLRDMDPAQQPEALADKRIDIGFTRQIPPDLQKVLASEILFREPLMVALPQAHALAKEPALALGQLASENFVLHAREASPELFDTIVGFCRRAKFSPRIVGSPNLWQSVLTLVEADEGVALIPACVQNLRSDGAVFRSLSDRNYLLDVVLAWRRNDPSALRDGFLKLVRSSRQKIECIMKCVQ